MDESGRILESCLTEFFAPGTTNDRKREIEVMLDTFSKQVGSWKQALYFLSTSSNQYVIMFCLNVIENSIKYRWLTGMSQQEQSELKVTLYSFLVQEATNIKAKHSVFVRNKIVKVITDIGKYAWPFAYPDFFANIYEILGNVKTVTIGIIFLKTVSEEWSVISDGVSTDRKNELKILLVEQVKDIFQALHRILLSALKQLPIQENRGSSREATQSSDLEHVTEVIVLSLETAAHYCSWIPLDGTIAHLIYKKQKSVPFTVDFIQLLCQISVMYLSEDQCWQQISTQALGVLNELLYRKFIPKDFDDQLNFVVRFSVELLNRLLSGTTPKSIDKQYSEKVVQFLCLVASSHFHRLDEATSKAFMERLVPYTFQQDNMYIYYECLEIWSRLLDHLNAQIPVLSMSPNREDYLNEIKHPVMGLANEIIHSSTKFNFYEDDCYLQDDDEESLTPGIGRNINVLVKIGELFPAESLQSVVSTWSESYRFYIGLQSRLDESKTVLKLDCSNGTNELEHFNFVVNLIGRVANIFYGDVFRNELIVGKSIFHQLVGLVVFSRNYFFVRSNQKVVQSILELLSALKTWTYWLSRYHLEIILTDAPVADQKSFFELLTHLCDNVFCALENRASVDREIVSVSGDFLVTLTTSIRTRYLFQLSSIQALIENIHSLRSSLDVETYRMLHKSVAAILMLPWYNSQDQQWPARTQSYTIYMKKLSAELILESRSATNLMLGLHILNDQLNLLQSEGSASKKMCWEVLKEILPYLQDLSLGYLRLPNICQELLTFFIRIMEVLQQQAGASFFEGAIQNFLNYFSAENIIDDLLREQENATYVVERFLEMLQYTVKDPSPSFKKFLPAAMSICFDHIFPIISTRSSPDLKVPFFTLIRNAVNYRWSYFFPGFDLRSNILRTNKTSFGGDAHHNQQHSLPIGNHNHCGPSPVNQDTVATTRTNQVLQSLGQSFLQSDIDVFRYNLNTLSLWNEKHNFFAKLTSYFPDIFDQFIVVLLQVLFQKCHDLLRDDVAVVLCEMTKVDFHAFQNKFLPSFLTSHFASLSNEQRNALIARFSPVRVQRDPCFSAEHHNNNTRRESNDENTGAVDSPTFTIMLTKFVDDLRFYHFLVECDRTNNPPAHSSDAVNKSQ